MVLTPRRAWKLDKLSWGTSCEADNNGRTLEELMRSLASITGNLIGGDTFAGGAAAEAGNRVIGLPLRSTGAHGVTVSLKIYAGAPVSFRTAAVHLSHSGR